LILCGLAVVLITMFTQPFMRGELPMASSLIIVVESAAVTVAFIVALYTLWSYHWGDRFEPIALLTIALALHMICAVFYTRALVTGDFAATSMFNIGWLLSFALQQWAGEAQVAAVANSERAIAQMIREKQGWVEALVPGVLVMCMAVTGMALGDEVTPHVIYLGSFALVLFAVMLAVREGLLYSRGQQTRARLQRAAVELEQSREQLHDINARRLELERNIELTARAGGVGLWDWDMRTNTVRYTREWKRELGYEDNEITNDFEEWRSRVHPDDRDRMISAIRAYVAQPRGEFIAEHRLRHRDGSYRWILTQASVLLGNGGRTQRMLGANIDITDRKNIELSLRQSETRYRELVDGLETRVAERTRELTDAYRESQSFAYAVAHDLKAPLRAIDGFSHLLEQSALPRLNANEQTYIKRVRHGAIHMASLIDGLLAYSRLEHRALHLGAIDCREVVDDVLRSMDTLVHAAQAVIRVDLPFCPVYADAEGLRIAIRNLLDNALKFASPARTPQIDIGAYETADRLVMTVRDNGIGFDPQYHDKIFEIFNRLHSTGYEGTGIGLALVRKALQRMQGKIWAESAPDCGATFYMSLPRASVQQSVRPVSAT
jgi:PAS domain S-box-containing protein